MFEQLIKAILDKLGIPKQEEMDFLSQKTDRLLKDIEKLKNQVMKAKESKSEWSDPASFPAFVIDTRIITRDEIIFGEFTHALMKNK